MESAGNQGPGLVWRRCNLADDDLTIEDYVASDGERDVGRVYYSITAHGRGAWCWFLWFAIYPNRGHRESRREALQAVEDRYATWRAGNEGSAALPGGRSFRA